VADGQAAAEVASSRRGAVAEKTLVLGLGNPILRDDGVGWRVVEAARRKTVDERVEFDCVALGGLALMERLIGYDRAFLVDAIRGERGPAGSVYLLTLDDLPTLHADAVHDASLKEALELGRRLGAHLPARISIVGVEARDVLDFGETLSPEVEAAVPAAVELLLAAIRLGVSEGIEGGTHGLT
jgi:hydrogenase maturation protease